MRKHLSEIIAEAAALPTKKEKVDFLKKNDSTSLRQIIGLALDPRVEWELPPGDPSRSDTEFQIDAEDLLYTEMRRMYLFIKPGNPIFPDKTNAHIKPIKKEILFVQLLEALPEGDKALLLAAKDKKLPVKGITRKLVNEVWPGLMPE